VNFNWASFVPRSRAFHRVDQRTPVAYGINLSLTCDLAFQSSFSCSGCLVPGTLHRQGQNRGTFLREPTLTRTLTNVRGID
jgi:hypothetical protein